jgi:CRP-like cAMP-binding protein
MTNHNPVLDDLVTYLQSLISAPVRAEVIYKFFKPLTIRKNEYILRQGSNKRPIIFVHSGYFRLFRNDPDGDGFTRAISARRKFLSDIYQFAGDGLAKQNIQAITDCEVALIYREEVTNLEKEFPEFKDVEIKVLEDVVVQFARRADQLLTQNAHHRYRLLVEQHPDLIRNVPIKDIASFLGITPQSLSRLRSNELRQP